MTKEGYYQALAHELQALEKTDYTVASWMKLYYSKHINIIETLHRMVTSLAAEKAKCRKAFDKVSQYLTPEELSEVTK